MSRAAANPPAYTLRRICAYDKDIYNNHTTTFSCSLLPACSPYFPYNSSVPDLLHCTVMNAFRGTKFKSRVIEGLMQFMKSALSPTPLKLDTINVCDMAVTVGYFTFSHVCMEYGSIICSHVF